MSAPPRRTAGQRIDYVFILPGTRVPGQVVGSRVVLDTPGPGPERLWPSDHYGVLAEITVGRLPVSQVAARPPPGPGRRPR